MLRSTLPALIALAALAGSPALAFEPDRAGRYGGLDLDKLDVGGRVTLTPSGCTPLSGHYASPSFLTWRLSCSGVYASGKSEIPIIAVSGADANEPRGQFATPNLAMAGRAFLLLQAAMDKQALPEVGVFVNLDASAGRAGLPSGNSAQKVGVQVSARSRPGAGTDPGSMWGLNLDIADEGKKPSFVVGEELDYHQNNPACAPDAKNRSGCFHVQSWHSYLSSYPADYDILINSQGANTYKHKCSVSGASVTATSSASSYSVGDTSTITIAGTRYRVASVQSAASLTLRKNIGTVTNADCKWSNNAVGSGLLMTDNPDAPITRDSDVILNTWSDTSISIGGGHRVGINMTNDRGLEHAILVPAGAKVCIKDNDFCFSYSAVAGVMTMSTGSSEAWQVDARGQQYASGFIVSATGSGNVAGVSCSGPPTSHFQVTKGIVTRC